jgi:hypothetical protein
MCFPIIVGDSCNSLAAVANDPNRKNRTKNAMAHLAFCRGIAPARRRLPHTVPTVREAATGESRYREHTVARLASYDLYRFAALNCDHVAQCHMHELHPKQR